MLTAGRPRETVGVALRREHALATRNRFPQALRLLNSLLGRSDLTPRQRFEAMCRKADCLERVRRPREAVELLRATARKYRTEPLVFSLLGEYLYRIQEDCHGALKALDRALRLRPKDADSLWWKGQVYRMGLARFGKARSAYAAALEVDPEYAPAMASLASLAETGGKWIEAIDWRKCHYRRTRWVGDLVALAELYLRLGNWAAAHKYARQGVRRASRDPSLWLVLAKALVAGKRLKRAVGPLKRFARLAGRGSRPALSSRDFASLEPALAQPEARHILNRLPIH